MIINIGIDIVEKKRIKKLINKNKKNFIKKILNKKEYTPFKKKKVEFLSKTFSIKETVVKILGTGFINNINLKNIKIKNNNLGKPILNMTTYKILISISHEKNITITTAVLLKFNCN